MKNMKVKEQFLIDHGWKKVSSSVLWEYPTSKGTTITGIRTSWWKAPVSLNGEDHYFDLETAYALESDGIGIHAYLAQESIVEALNAFYEACMNDAEATRYAQTGIPLGEYPNY